MAGPAQHWGFSSNVTSSERPSLRNPDNHSVTITHPVSLHSTQYHLKLPFTVFFVFCLPPAPAPVEYVLR